MAALSDDLDLISQAASTTLRSSHSKQLHRRATAPALPIFLGPTRTTERAPRAAGGSRSGRQSLCGSRFLDCLHRTTKCLLTALISNLPHGMLHSAWSQAFQSKAVCNVEEALMSLFQKLMRQARGAGHMYSERRLWVQ